MGKPKPPINPRDIFDRATGFDRAARLIGAAFTAGDELMRRPLVSNSSFSLELYLKCLLHLDGQPEKAKGHELAKLYGSLGPINQTAVLVRYEQYKLASPLMQLTFQQEREGIKPTLAWDIGSVLGRINEAFPLWRYDYEQPGHKMVYNGAQPIRDAVRSVILDRQPSWPWREG